MAHTKVRSTDVNPVVEEASNDDSFSMRKACEFT